MVIRSSTKLNHILPALLGVEDGSLLLVPVRDRLRFLDVVRQVLALTVMAASDRLWHVTRQKLGNVILHSDRLACLNKGAPKVVRRDFRSGSGANKLQRVIWTFNLSLPSLAYEDIRVARCPSLPLKAQQLSELCGHRQLERAMHLRLDKLDERVGVVHENAGFPLQGRALVESCAGKHERNQQSSILGVVRGVAIKVHALVQ